MGDDGGGHWLVRMECRPAGWYVCLPLLIFPCTIKSRSSLLAQAHPVVPEKGRKTVVLVVTLVPLFSTLFLHSLSLNTHPTADYIEKFRIIRAKARCTIKTRKRESWCRCVSSINNRTSMKKVSTVIRKISGKYSSTKIHHLDVNGDEVTDIPDISNSLGNTFSQDSSSQHCQKFDSYWHKAENNRSSLNSKNLET